MLFKKEVKGGKGRLDPLKLDSWPFEKNDTNPSNFFCWSMYNHIADFDLMEKFKGAPPKTDKEWDAFFKKKSLQPLFYFVDKDCGHTGLTMQWTIIQMNYIANHGFGNFVRYIKSEKEECNSQAGLKM